MGCGGPACPNSGTRVSYQDVPKTGQEGCGCALVELVINIIREVKAMLRLVQRRVAMATVAGLCLVAQVGLAAPSVKSFTAKGRARIAAEGQAAAIKAADEAAVTAALRRAIESLGRDPDRVGGEDLGRFVVGTPRCVAGPLVRDGEVSVTMCVDVDVTALEEAVGRSPRRHDRILVIIDEVIITHPAPDPAAERAIEECLDKAHFIVIDEGAMDRLRQRREIDALENGDWEAARALAKEFGCDVIVAGEGFAEETARDARFPDFRRCSARLEIRAYRPDTAQQLCARTSEGKGMDPSVVVAGKRALQQAAENLCEDLRECLTRSAPMIHVQVTELSSLTWVQRIEEHLRSIPGVDEVKRRTYDKAMASWDIFGDAPAEDVAAGLRKCPEPQLQVLEQTDQAVYARVVE
jgi:hypothetical protein